MTLPLTDSEIDYAKRLAAMDKSDDLAPARGIVVGMLIGSVLWVLIGIVIYFKCFN